MKAVNLRTQTSTEQSKSKPATLTPFQDTAEKALLKLKETIEPARSFEKMITSSENTTAE